MVSTQAYWMLDARLGTSLPEERLAFADVHALSLDEARKLSQLIHRHHGFRADLTHFAITASAPLPERGGVR